MELVVLEPAEEDAARPPLFTYDSLGILRSDYPVLKQVEEFSGYTDLSNHLELDWDQTIDETDKKLQERGLMPVRTEFAGSWLVGQDAYLPQWEEPCRQGGVWECILSTELRASTYRIPKVSDRVAEQGPGDITRTTDPIPDLLTHAS